MFREFYDHFRKTWGTSYWTNEMDDLYQDLRDEACKSLLSPEQIVAKIESKKYEIEMECVSCFAYELGATALIALASPALLLTGWDELATPMMSASMLYLCSFFPRFKRSSQELGKMEDNSEILLDISDQIEDPDKAFDFLAAAKDEEERIGLQELKKLAELYEQMPGN